MEPLIILLTAFLVALPVTKMLSKKVNYLFSGRLAMAVMLLFTGVGHFIYTDGMSMMLPDFFPFKKEIIYLTGIFELLGAIGLLVNRTVKVTGIFLILFFIGVLPSNILAAINNVNIPEANYNGYGIDYLWFRVPLQIFFILWVYFFAIRNKKPGNSLQKPFKRQPGILQTQ